ncbi:MAG TPA: hypothetical protein VGC54_01220 [Planctomycetota bacterium]
MGSDIPRDLAFLERVRAELASTSYDEAREVRDKAEPRGEHSAKPEVVRTLVEQVSPGPYLELFGRRAERGWTVYGNQVGGTSVGRTACGSPLGEDGRAFPEEEEPVGEESI